MSLVTRERTQRTINQGSFSAAENKLIDGLIAAGSTAVEQYCRRRFQAQLHDELYPGTGANFLFLRQYPLVAVHRVAANPETVLTVTNTSSTNQRATVAVTSTGLSLTRVASGTSSTDTSVTFAANATLAAVAAAINALGNGWSASVVAGYASWAALDLRAIQGAFQARDHDAELKIHIEDLADYEVDAERGWLRRADCGAWVMGCNEYRVVYTAGYSPVPEDVQEAVAQWVATLYWQAKRDPGLTQELVPGIVSRSMVEGVPRTILQFLAPYRSRPI